MAHTLRLILVIATLLEILLSTTLLAIFVYVFNNDITTILWYDGGAQGWNSDPSLRVYEYANYRELPPVPLIWDIRCELLLQSTLCLCGTLRLFSCPYSSTKSNIFIALVTIVIWIIRCFVNFWDACSLDLCGTLIANAAYDIMLIALWAYSSVAQSSGDFTDTQHISIRPWYLAQGCDQAHGRSRGACEIMVAAYELSVFAT
jgi:hypothetical protein